MNQNYDDAKPGENEMGEDEIDEILEESFPASDPPSWTVGTDHGRKEPSGARKEQETEKPKKTGIDEDV